MRNNRRWLKLKKASDSTPSISYQFFCSEQCQCALNLLRTVHSNQAPSKYQGVATDQCGQARSLEYLVVSIA